MSDIAREDVARMDAGDPLSDFRAKFDLPSDLIYLDGNSLGPAPLATADRISAAISREWAPYLISGWHVHNWLEAPARVGNKIARLIGASSGEVVVTDSTSVNLFKCLSAALSLVRPRSKIVSESGNFPGDLYIIQGMERMLAGSIQLQLCDPEQIIDNIDEDTALVLLTHVHYKTAKIHDMRAITARAHEKGALVIWDLSHSVGAVDVNLNEAGADFAVGCGYKYLNGGPGCPAFIFVAKKHQDSSESPLAGWLSHGRPFDFVDEYEPAAGISRFLCGAYPVFGILALEVGVDLMLSARQEDVWSKARRLADLFMSEVEKHCVDLGVEIVGPRDSRHRGSHVCLRYRDADALVKDLAERNIVAEFRAPDMIRFAFAPLYVSYEEAWTTAYELRDVLTRKALTQNS